MVEGEGTVTLRRGYSHHRRYFFITPAVLIYNTSTKLLDFTSKILEKSVLHPSRKHRNLGIIYVLGRDAVQLIHRIRPYLASKGEIADLVIEFSESRNSGLIERDSRGRYKPRPYTDAEIALYDRVKQFNLRSGKVGKWPKSPNIH